MRLLLLRSGCGQRAGYLVRVGLFVATLQLAGCAPARDPLSVPPAPTDAWERTDCWFSPTFSFLPSTRKFACGYVTVPLRHEDPSAGDISLPVAILPAEQATADAEPLFVAQGGPGGDVFDVFADAATYSSASTTHDLVLFNQRGTLGSDPELTCPEVWDAAEELAELPTDESTELERELLANCHDRLVEEGVDLAAFNSVQNAADIESIRAALGYPAFSFYGVSYGSRLGLHLLRQSPPHLRSVVLDAVVPTNINFLEEVAHNTARLFHEIDRACREDDRCARDYPDLEDRLYKLADKLDDEPAVLTLSGPEGQVEEPLDGDGLINALFDAAYLTDGYSVIPRTIWQMEHGDYRFLSALESYFAFDETDSEGMYLSVVCSEDGTMRSAAQIPGYADPSGATVNPRLIRVMAEDAQDMVATCAEWSVPHLPPAASESVASDVPVLLLSGRFDPITPPANGAAAANSLNNAKHIVDPIGSHGAAFDGGCVDDIVADFLDNGPAHLDTECVDASSPGFVSKNAIFLPWLAGAAQFDLAVVLRALLAASVLAFLASIVVLWALAFLVRKWRHFEPDQTPRERKLRWAARTLFLAYLGLATLFVAGLTLFSIHALTTQLVTAFSISEAAWPLFIIPPVLLVLTFAMLASVLWAWRSGRWPLWERLVYSVAVLGAFSYVVILAADGLLMPLL